MSEEADAAWLADQREVAVAYLKKEGIAAPELGKEPAFFLTPYVSLWAVRSKKNPAAIGWWIISGDLPTDYLSANDVKVPREAFAAFARRWEEASGFMLRGESHPDFSIGTEENLPELGDLLRRRSGILKRFSEDDALWNEG